MTDCVGKAEIISPKIVREICYDKKEKQISKQKGAGTKQDFLNRVMLLALALATAGLDS